MRRLYAGLYHDAVHMSLVCCIRPSRIYLWCIRRDDHRPMLARTPVTRILTSQVLPCCPIRLAGPACCPGHWCFCLTGDGVRDGLRADMPLCLGHEVADQPHHTLLPLVEVATCVLGNSWRGTRVRIPRPQGLRSICLLASLDQLEAVVIPSLGYLPWP